MVFTVIIAIVITNLILAENGFSFSLTRLLIFGMCESVFACSNRVEEEASQCGCNSSSCKVPPRIASGLKLAQTHAMAVAVAGFYPQPTKHPPLMHRASFHGRGILVKPTSLGLLREFKLLIILVSFFTYSYFHLFHFSREVLEKIVPITAVIHAVITCNNAELLIKLC